MQKGRLYPKHQIEALEQQLKQLQLQESVLQQQRASLKLQHTIATSFCEILGSLRTGSLHEDWLCAKGGILAEELPLLLDLGLQVELSQLFGEEQQQLRQQQQEQQQQQQPPSRVTRANAAVAACRVAKQNGYTTANRTVSCCQPDGEPTAAIEPAAKEPVQPLVQFSGDSEGLLKYAWSQPPYPGADAWTLADFADHYEATVKEITFTLHLLEQCQERGDDVCTDVEQQKLKLRQLQLNHVRALVTVLLLNPDDLLHKLRVLNVATRELSDTPEQAHNRHCWLIDKLQLIDNQRQVITAGGHLFSRLLDRIRAERSKLMAQQQAQMGERLPSGRAADLQGQQDMAERFHILLQKERILLTMASSVVGSVLDVVQLSKAFVLTWPWIPHMGMLSGILAARDKQQQQHNQQQQQQPQKQEEEHKENCTQQKHHQQMDQQQEQQPQVRHNSQAAKEQLQGAPLPQQPQQQQHPLLPPLLPSRQTLEQQQQQLLLQQQQCTANLGKRPGSAV